MICKTHESTHIEAIFISSLCNPPRTFSTCNLVVLPAFFGFCENSLWRTFIYSFFTPLKTIIYREIFARILFSLLSSSHWVNLRQGENTAMSGQIQNGAKPFARVKGQQQKNHGEKIALYTVCQRHTPSNDMTYWKCVDFVHENLQFKYCHQRQNMNWTLRQTCISFEGSLCESCRQLQSSLANQTGSAEYSWWSRGNHDSSVSRHRGYLGNCITETPRHTTQRSQGKDMCRLITQRSHV